MNSPAVQIIRYNNYENMIGQDRCGRLWKDTGNMVLSADKVKKFILFIYWQIGLLPKEDLTCRKQQKLSIKRGSFDIKRVRKCIAWE